MSARAGRILYSSYYGDLDGGGELRMLDHIRHSSFGTGRFAALVFKEGELAERLRSWGVPTTVIAWNWKQGPRRSAALYPGLFARVLGHLIRNRPTLLVANGYLDLQLTGPPAALLGIPIVWRARAEFFPNLPPRPSRHARASIWFVRRYASRIVTTTAYERTQILSHGVPEDRVSTVYNGVDVGRFEAARGARDRIRGEWGIGAETIVLGVVARLTRLKGHETMVEALRSLANGPENWRAVFVGNTAEEPEYASELRGRVSEAGLDGRVSFVGYREDIPEVLSAVDIFVLPSHRETFGTAVIEAMASGKPVIATRTPGPSEVLADGSTGLLVPTGNAEALARAIRGLLRDPARMRALGASAHEDAARRYSLEAMMRGLDEACAAAAPSLRRPAPLP